MMEVSNQMLELYEQNRVPQSHGNETEGSSAAGTSHHAPPRAPSYSEETATEARSLQVSKAAPMQSTILASYSTNPAHNQSYLEKQNGLHGSMHTEAVDHARHEQRSSAFNSKVEAGTKVELGNHSYYGHENSIKGPAVPTKEGAPETREKNNGSSENVKGSSPMLDAIKKIDKDKVKAALEKRRKARGDVMTRKVDPMDEDDLIERELEHGVELAVEDERSKLEKGHVWSKSVYSQESQNSDHVIENGYRRTEKTATIAEDELSLDARTPPAAGSHKIRAISPNNHRRTKDGHNIPPNQLFPSKYQDNVSDLRRAEISEHSERDHERLRQEN